MTEKSQLEKEVEEAFPAPEFRKYQKEAIMQIVKEVRSGNRAVLYDAPTGSGKSLVLYTAGKVLEGDTFYSTPLKSLQDQITDDEFFGDDVIEIKGRGNYPCIHPDEKEGVMVDKALCQRESGFECGYKGDCPYYVQKNLGLNSETVVMNMSYLMAEGRVDPEADMSFGNRNTLVLDECQSLDDWALNFVGFTISPYTVPKDVWEAIDIPKDRGEDIAVVREWLREDVLPVVINKMEALSQVASFSEDQLSQVEQLEEFKMKVENFIHDSEENEWTATYDSIVRKNKSNYSKIKCEPLFVGRFMESLVWDRAEHFILASATLPPNEWLEEIGLEESEVSRIKVPHTFPVENRKIITDHTVGKMTKGEREGNMPAAVEKVKVMSDHHSGEKGIVHARGYNYVQMFKRSAQNNGHGKWFRENVYVQNRDSRDEDLQNWIDGDKQIFLSVNMAEGIDLEGEKCRWQVLLKTLYPFMGDKRINKRVSDMGDWDFYNRHAVTQVEQAYGRAVRSPEDEAVFYILDESAIGLIKMNAELFHTWFLEAIVDMSIDPSRGV